MALVKDWKKEINTKRDEELRRIQKSLATLINWKFFNHEFQGLDRVSIIVEDTLMHKRNK